MTQELEIEFKNLLTESEYMRLFTHFNFSDKDFFTQENYYFDTQDYMLKKIEAALRIRIKEQHAQITLKTPQDSHLLETNVDLSVTEAKNMVKEGKFFLPQVIQETIQTFGLFIDEVFLHTDLKTKRVEKKDGHELVVLDQSWYGDQMDFELEVESDDPRQGEVYFLSVLEQFSIPKRETPNKIQRAFIK